MGRKLIFIENGEALRIIHIRRRKFGLVEGLILPQKLTMNECKKIADMGVSKTGGKCQRLL